MLKRALKFAVGPGVGIVAGSLVFRMANQHLYGETWPPVWKQAVLYFLVGYSVCVLVFLLIEWVKQKLGTGR